MQTKNVISMKYGSSTSSWKPEMSELDLIFKMMDIYINSKLDTLTKFTTSNRITEFNDILLWKISQMITDTVSVSMRILTSCAIKWEILLFVWQKVNGNWDNNIIRIFQWKESHYKKNTSIKINKFKRAGLRVTVRNPSWSYLLE